MARGMPGFFDIDERLKDLSAKGDDLERIKALVDFEMFRPDLEAAVPRSDRSKGGRPPFDHVLMFKILILQAMHSLSDERAEYLIKDRLSFMRFLGLSLADAVPDANTIWTFREALKEAAAIDGLFRRFHGLLFTNDLWLLNPKTDLMIRMLPEQFFQAVAVHAAGWMLAGQALLTALWALPIVLTRGSARKEKP